MVVDALQKVGAARSIVIDEHGVILAGNGVTEAAAEAGITKVRVIDASGDELIAVRRSGLTDEQKVALAIYDNRGAELAEWNIEQLVQDQANGIDLTPYFFAEELAKLLPADGTAGLTDADEVPKARATDIVLGDLFVLGRHRVLCGDSTKAEDVGRLMAGQKAALVHADPPYGMGKEKDGVENDNLFAEKLDAFQMSWWRSFRPHTQDNGSAYIWGNSEGLWRLWYRGGLKDSERLTFRNEIAWDKKTAMGMSSADHRQFPTATERCLFFMIGEQGFNNNADNYWDGWEGVRSALEADCKKMGWTPDDIKRICGVGMYSHWFTKSQWTFIPEEHYRKLQSAAREHDAFKREHDELKREHDAFKREHDELKREFYATRAYFDNTHDNMTDVWEFPRVTGEERHGHATPKPVAMICRAIQSSTAQGALIVEPFLGSGTTLIAAEQLGRQCYGMEISPCYCQVIIDRWEAFTGLKAIKVDA